MTFEDLAKDYFGDGLFPPDGFKDAWYAATKAERESCAEVAEEFEDDMGHGKAQKIADTIRMRSNDAGNRRCAPRTGNEAMNDEKQTHLMTPAGAASELSAGLCMVVGKRYIVTKGSNDGTFEIGDHIVLCRDGAIECKEAQGWIDASEAAAASAGMEVTIDQIWIERQKQKLREELAVLDA